MKILMVNKFLYPRGGCETYMLNLGEELRVQGHEVEYFGMYDEKNTVGNSAGLYTSNMDFHSNDLKRFLYPFKIIYSNEAYKKISKVLDDFKPDIVHMNNINFQLTPSIIYAVKKRGIPLVQTVHDYQMICPNHLLYSFAETKPCERCINGSKLNCLSHKCIHDSRAKSLLGVIEAWLYKILKTYKKVDLYVCPSRFLEEKLRAASANYEGKTFTIHNFIEKKPLPERVASEKLYIAFVARLSKEKGVDILAQAAKLMPEYKFVIAGTGPDDACLQNIPNVELKGFLSGDALTSLMANARVMVLPSVWYENCPLSILESYSFGVPVVTMNHGGMVELVENGKTGCLVSESTPQSLSEALKKCFDDEAFYENLVSNCKEMSEKIMDVRDYTGIIVGKYQELINKR